MNINGIEIKSPSDVVACLANVGYYADIKTANVVYLSFMSGKPILLEGEQGTGKTFLAQSVAKAFNLPCIRAQMYEGLTDDKLLYDYNYQKQLLVMECVKQKLYEDFENASFEELVQVASQKINFYSPEFLVERPILKTINGTGKKVLICDEIDKAPEEIEHMLHEFLEDYSISIPEYGTITCPREERPIVFITSNGYRDLLHSFKRRCLYLYMGEKTKSQIVDILTTAIKANKKLIECVAICLQKSQRAEVNYKPSIAEGIDWLNYLASLDECSKADFIDSLGFIIKDSNDMSIIQKIVEESLTEVFNNPKITKNDTLIKRKYK